MSRPALFLSIHQDGGPVFSFNPEARRALLEAERTELDELAERMQVIVERALLRQEQNTV